LILVARHRGDFLDLQRRPLDQELASVANAQVPEVPHRGDSRAALEDSRFVSVTRDEVDGLSIEISVLTPFHRINDVNEIEVGKHGLYIVRGASRGLLLPQVATQYGWDRTRFLEHTCIKSGLPESAWRDPQTVIYTFEAEVFSEESVNN